MNKTLQQTKQIRTSKITRLIERKVKQKSLLQHLTVNMNLNKGLSNSPQCGINFSYHFITTHVINNLLQYNKHGYK